VGIDSRQIQYTVKIANDPANAAQAAAAAANVTKQVEAYKALVGSLQQTIKASADRIALLEKELVVTKEQVKQELALARARKESSKAGSVLGGLGRSSGSNHGLGETARINNEGNLRLNIFSHLNSVIDLAIAGIIGNKVLDIADKFAELTGKIKLNTDSEAQANAVREKLISLSERTHTSLESNVETWEKLVQVGRVYHKSQSDILQVQETLIKGLRLGGATTSQASAATNQFVAILNRGRASAFGFNTLFKQSPELMNMLAKAMDKPISAFTTMSRKSRLSMQEILKAVQEIAPEVEKKFARLPVTMKQGFTDTVTDFEVMVGKLGETIGISPKLGQFFERLAAVFRDPDFQAGVAKVTDELGGLLVKALDVLSVAIQFAAHHTTLLADTFALLTAYLEFKFAKGLATAIFGFAKFSAEGEIVAGKMGLIQRVLRDVGAAGLIPINAFGKLTGLFKATAVAAGEEAVAVTAAGVATEEAAAATAVATGGLSLIAGALTAAVIGAYAYSDAVKVSKDSSATLADVGSAAWDIISEAASTAASWVGQKWTELEGWFSSTLWPAIQNAASIAAENVGGAFGQAASYTLTIWSLMPEQMQGIFNQIVSGAQTAGNNIANILGPAVTSAIKTAWNGTLTNLGNTFPMLGIVGQSLGGGSILLGNAIQRAEDAKNKFDVGDTNFLNKLKLGLANSALNKKLAGGAPIGGPDGGKQKKDRAADALRNLQDYIDATKEAITEQDKLNTAIYGGPAAERAAQVAAAREKERLHATQELEKAKKGLSKTTKGAAEIEAAADAAATLELSKQEGQRRKVIEGIKLQAEAAQAETENAYKGLQVWTADAALRRQRIIDLARENAEYAERQKLIQQQYDPTTPDALAAIRKAGQAGADKAIFDDAHSAVEKFNDLLKQSNDYTDQGLADWKAIVAQVQTAVDSLHPAPDEIAKVNRELMKLKPPQNFMEALHTGLQNFADEFRMGWKEVADGIKGTVDDLANSFIDMATTGKISFKKLALSIIQDLERMIVKALIFKAVMAVMNAVFPGSGSILGAVGGGGIPKGHSGGIVGMGADALFNVHPGAFAAARRFHTGGLVGLKSGEIPVIAKRGEAIMPTVRMPDGTFGVKAVGGGKGGGTFFAPNINISIDAKGRGPGGGNMSQEQMQTLTHLLDDEINTHLQRKLEDWMRPGGPLYASRHR
jgi:lambda family phage tail tape measure protein